WSVQQTSLVKAISERIEPRLREVASDVNRALRRSREATDRLDPDLVLAALNGMFVLATVRACRDSLGVNAVFDQAWMQVGQSLEMHIERLLEVARANPTDAVAIGRLD